jgi:hypothetical protein
MRRTPSAHVLLAAAALAAAAATLGSPLAARADTGSTFSNFAADISLNDAGSFLLAPLGGTGPLVIDPNNPDTLYAVNRAKPTSGGVYPFSLSTQARISNSAGPIYFGSVAPMTWADTTTGDPYSAVVGLDGNLYVSMYTSAGVFKITSPLSDTPTVTKIMSSYNNPATGGTDDDMTGLGRMPANFGLANYSANDLVIFDDGNNNDGINTISALHSDGQDGNFPTILWQRSSAAPGTIHGATSDLDGYAYWINTLPEHNVIDGVDRVSVYRINGSGVLQTVGLSLPAGVTLDQSDDPIAINPVDGSLWLADAIFADDGTGTIADTQGRTMLRIDLAHLTPSTSDPNAFIATATAEFSANSFNIGVNGLTFTPDGTQLLVGTPNGTDKLWAFNVIPAAAPVHNPGDTNNDGVVDLTDLNNVLNNFGSTGANPGDDTGDGVVDLTDLNNVLNNFGTTYAASALNVVPEPASLSLLGLGAAAFLTRRRSR